MHALISDLKCTKEPIIRVYLFLDFHQNFSIFLVKADIKQLSPLAPPSGYALNLKALIKVSKVS